MSDARTLAERSDTPTTPVAVETGADIDAFVAANDVALVDVYRPGCTLCDAIEPIVGAVAKASGVAVATCNPQRDLDVVDDYDIRSVPTLLLFVDGELVGRLAEGFQGTDAVFAFLAEHLDANRDVLPDEYR
ncbi:thioredoxin family protein [Halarchaeum nitratireducens]|uniref:Thiol reductase thioredoxin n=1 Tax=Halarchaeum nitratireducens TaxID=489913 RepID=A0A830GE68_9EURY|nr:thioredoxin family protein [Halarchaeum nitratireducens]MBP2251719.1 thioredoxin-like negative regulator of GroEL [Halarchaeum solikamskense]GGN22789.1 thiol reductase thioredoxin [Halarchaeum nitratireducens]